MLAVLGHAVRRVTHADASAIQALFDADPDTYALLEGAPPRPDEAYELLRELPPNTPPERKHTFLVDDVAVIDLIEGYPEPRTWILGLIFVAAPARGQGLGTRLITAIAAHIRAAGGSTLRLGVVSANPAARRLYDRLGFALVARRPRTTWSGGEQAMDVLELDLTA